MTAKEMIYDLLSPLTGAQLIWAYQGGPIPPEPYIAMHRMNTRAGEWDNEFPVDADGNVNVSGRRSTRLELQCYGDEPEDILSSMVQRLRWPTVIERAVELGVSINDDGPVHNMPVLRESSGPATYQQRAIVELTLSWTHTTTDKPGLIERVEYDADIDGRITHHTVEVNTNGEA